MIASDLDPSVSSSLIMTVCDQLLESCERESWKGERMIGNTIDRHEKIT